MASGEAAAAAAAAGGAEEEGEICQHVFLRGNKGQRCESRSTRVMYFRSDDDAPREILGKFCANHYAVQMRLHGRDRGRYEAHRMRLRKSARQPSSGAEGVSKKQRVKRVRLPGRQSTDVKSKAVAFAYYCRRHKFGTHYRNAMLDHLMSTKHGVDLSCDCGKRLSGRRGLRRHLLSSAKRPAFKGEVPHGCVAAQAVYLQVLRERRDELDGTYGLMVATVDRAVVDTSWKRATLPSSRRVRDIAAMARSPSSPSPRSSAGAAAAAEREEAGVRALVRSAVSSSAALDEPSQAAAAAVAAAHRVSLRVVLEQKKDDYAELCRRPLAVRQAREEILAHEFGMSIDDNGLLSAESRWDAGACHERYQRCIGGGPSSRFCFMLEFYPAGVAGVDSEIIRLPVFAMRYKTMYDSFGIRSRAHAAPSHAASAASAAARDREERRILDGDAPYLGRGGDDADGKDEDGEPGGGGGGGGGEESRRAALQMRRDTRGVITLRNTLVPGCGYVDFWNNMDSYFTASNVDVPHGECCPMLYGVPLLSLVARAAFPPLPSVFTHIASRIVSEDMAGLTELPPSAWMPRVEVNRTETAPDFHDRFLPGNDPEYAMHLLMIPFLARRLGWEMVNPARQLRSLMDAIEYDFLNNTNRPGDPYVWKNYYRYALYCTWKRVFPEHVAAARPPRNDFLVSKTAFLTDKTLVIRFDPWEDYERGCGDDDGDEAAAAAAGGGGGGGDAGENEREERAVAPPKRRKKTATAATEEKKKKKSA